MICPVCDHAQEGAPECDVCGARLSAPPAAPVVASPLPGLEPTGLGGGAPAPAAEARAPWVESTASAPAPDGAVEPIEIDRTGHEAPVPARPPLAAAACRYCRAPAAPGQVFCDACGMRLPSHRSDPLAAPPEAVRCRGCGTVVTGRACPGCGARVPDAGEGAARS